MNAPPKEEKTPITEIAKKPPHKSLFLPLSPDHDVENVNYDSDTELLDLQVPIRVSEIRRNVQLKFLGEHFQMRENREHGSRSSPTPGALPETSASSYPPEPEHPENIEQPSSPLPPEPFPEPSPEHQELEPEPSTSSGIAQTPAKTYQLDKSITLFLPTPSQASSSFLAPVVPWSNMGLFLYDIG